MRSSPVPSGSGTGNGSGSNGNFTSARQLLSSQQSQQSSSPAPAPAPAPNRTFSNSSKGKAPLREGSGPVTTGAATGQAGGNGGVMPNRGVPVVMNANPGTPAGIGPGGNVRRPALNNILVNTCQKGNPVIAHIRGVGWEYGDIVPDYQVGATTCVLYLSLRYHLLHPEYIHNRIEKLGQTYSLRILLILCDSDSHNAAMKELTKVCIVNGFTMIVAWTAQEAATYLTTYKSFERKPPDLIKERVDDDYISQLTSVLTTVKGVNKTDVVTLASSYGSFAEIALASSDSLVSNPGVGEKKAKRLREAFSGKFVMGKKSALGGRNPNKKSRAQERDDEGDVSLN